MPRIHGVTAVLAVALVMAGAACGEDADDEQPAAEAADEAASSGARDVERFLLREGEEPGFSPDGNASTIVGVNALALEWGLPPAEADQLRDRGFISFTRRQTNGGLAAGGVSEVLLFATPEGARAQLEHDLRASTIHATLPDTEIHRFTVPGIPGARGWTGSDLHGNPIGTVQWVQGRCVLLLVNEGDVPFIQALSAGAEAIYERTGGDCP
jgi:hypothetical protein